MIVAYLVVAFVIFFFTFKKYYPILMDKVEGNFDLWVEYREFWIMALFPTLWIISIPVVLAWKTLEFLYNKFTQTNTKNKAE